MEIVLMKNRSADIKITKEVEEIKRINGKIKEDTNILDPVFLVKSASTDYNNINYLYIPDLKRYYYLRTPKMIGGGLVELICHQDCLMSWNSTIRQQSGIISRQEYLYNTYLQDNAFREYAYPLIQQKTFPSGFTENPNILLALVGGAN